MNSTTHLLQLSISVDEETIRQQVASAAVAQVTSAINNGFVKRSMYGKPEMDSKLQDMIHELTEDIVASHKDDIINSVIDKVADKIVRSKAMREKVSKLLESKLIKLMED